MSDDLTEALEILRLIIDEVPCTAIEEDDKACVHGWTRKDCPDRRAWELLKRHQEVLPLLPTDFVDPPVRDLSAITGLFEGEPDLSARVEELLYTQAFPDGGVRGGQRLSALASVPLSESLRLDPFVPQRGAPGAHATEYEVSVFPVDSENHLIFAIKVQYRGGGLWAVTRNRSILNRDGVWRLMPRADEEGNPRCRFWLDEALHLARKAAPHVKTNGYTATQALEDPHAP